MKFLSQGSHKLEHEHDRQTGRQTNATEHITRSHSRVGTNEIWWYSAPIYLVFWTTWKWTSSYKLSARIVCSLSAKHGRLS